jgi:hypothetical protein
MVGIVRQAWPPATGTSRSFLYGYSNLGMTGADRPGSVRSIRKSTAYWFIR